MDFEEYKKEVIKFGKEISWKFVFRVTRYYDVELLAPTVNNLNHVIKWFSYPYIVQNEDWTTELNWLKKVIMERRV